MNYAMDIESDENDDIIIDDVDAEIWKSSVPEFNFMCLLITKPPIYYSALETS